MNREGKTQGPMLILEPGLREPPEPVGTWGLRLGDAAPEGTPGTGENLCPHCRGKGLIADMQCPVCEGTGVVIEAVG